jgi:hypothetical protein
MSTISKSLLAALSLIISAFASQAATNPIKIFSLPFNITAPGTYQLASNLTCSIYGTAITINSTVAGKILLNLEGFTISQFPNETGFAGGIVVQANPTNSNITIENGTITNFGVGVLLNPSGTSAAPSYLSNVHLDSLTFFMPSVQTEAAVFLGQVSSSSVNNCSFNGPVEISAIMDWYSKTGNSYSNNTFHIGNNNVALQVWVNAPSLLEDCRFGVPVN